jgi:regulator of sigma E protease
MTWVISIFLLIVTLVIHEGGHAIAAIAQGIPVKEYFIGLPHPRWLTLKVGKFKISPILILAGVVIDDETYYQASFRKKVLIALAGPAANLAIGLVTAVYIFGFAKGWHVTTAFVQATIQSIAMLFTDRVPVSVLVSPIGVVAVSNGALQQNLLQGTELMWLVLSFSIPIVNLLPIPALDGGQILTAIICHAQGNTPKAIRGSKMVTKVYFCVLAVGMILLVVKDILHFFR